MEGSDSSFQEPPEYIWMTATLCMLNKVLWNILLL